MFDLGWGEILLVGVIALIVVGPKELPGMFKALGQVVGRMRAMAREFQRAMDSAASETGVKDLSTGIKAATSPKQLGLDKFNELADRVKDGLNIPDNKIMSTALNTPPPKKKPAEHNSQTNDSVESLSEVEKPLETEGGNTQPEDTNSTQELGTEVNLSSDSNGNETKDNQKVSVQ